MGVNFRHKNMHKENILEETHSCLAVVLFGSSSRLYRQLGLSRSEGKKSESERAEVASHVFCDDNKNTVALFVYSQ